MPLIAFVSQAVPAIAGLVAGRTVGRWFGDEDGGSVVAGLTGLLAGVLLGVVSGVLVWVAGGSLGDGALAQVGAPALATGIAVAAQSGHRGGDRGHRGPLAVARLKPAPRRARLGSG